MTPAQSLVFLALTLAAVLCLVWCIAEFDRVMLKRKTASAEGAPTNEGTGDDSGPSSPDVHLERAPADPRQGPAEVYDWAGQGI